MSPEPKNNRKHADSAGFQFLPSQPIGQACPTLIIIGIFGCRFIGAAPLLLPVMIVR
ncbi:hypothetical protein H8B02_20410 [Bradyrhizobium sp. Pear77]|uniref:hypothetical protein n=1 Tax=Bradyrhizobium TaxID=374 RepID=UPI001E37902D|nr:MULTISPECIES: hypothetical protein [Bradyrhizobium]MCC8955708.1 hypothetical protein [Bradyrhizobium altum]MCC8968106.1 hypothetical protein [Bradyrhizobium oropedii]